MSKKKKSTKSDKKASVGSKLIQSLRELIEALRSDKPIEDCFNTTTYHDDGSVTRTTPKKKRTKKNEE